LSAMGYLRNHPFAVDAYFVHSLVLAFAVPKERLQKFIPDCLSLDTYKDRWGFLAVAMVQTKGLRPKGFPKIFGNDFFLVGYRIFVRYRNQRGKRLRGLYIIKSETDKVLMKSFGNIFTHYHYTTTDIHQKTASNIVTIESVKSDLSISYDASISDAAIPDGSPFSNWKDARRFAGPLPHTFTVNKKNNTVLIIKGVRQNWQPKPVQIKDFHIGLLNTLDLVDAGLASAFEVRNIPYRWEKGILEKW
jgi:uncharacterized protein YqjF (DUF2071 family)